MYERILVPLDGSPAAEGVLAHARTLAACSGSLLVLLRVVEPLMMPPWATFAGPELSAEEPAGEAEEAARYLQAHVETLREAGIAAEAVVRHGPAVDEILTCIHERRIDLVALSAQGRSGILKLFGGSTAESLLARARVPVLVVPAPPH